MTIKSIVDTIISGFLNSLGTLFIGIATAAFFYGVFRYIIGAREGNEKKIEEGNKFLIWGGVTLFVMASVWGIVSYFQTTLGFPQNDITIPGFVPPQGNAPR